MQKYVEGSNFFPNAPLAQNHANFGLKRRFCKLVPNPSCVPNLKLLASTVAEISRGPNLILVPDAPLIHTPAKFGPKRCFFGKLVPNKVVYEI